MSNEEFETFLAGEIGVRAGAVMGNSDRFKITGIEQSGNHGKPRKIYELDL